MNRIMMASSCLAAGMAIALASAAEATSPRHCAPDAVQAGTICLDRYEASVWRVPNPTTANRALVHRIQLGLASRGDLLAGGATQLGTMTTSDSAPCASNGQNCANDSYAVSLPLETPSAFATWFQAEEACANSGKRLPTSAEWQIGANGTQDPGPDNGTTDCNTDDALAIPTGARSGCVSARGAFDMVGNLAEWVADWVPATTGCPGWASFSNDQMCLSGASTTANSPGALVRGGASASIDGPSAGPFAISVFPPFRSAIFVGFRCAR